MKKFFFFAAIAAIGLASCSNDETIASQATSESNAISFRPLVNGVTRAADIDAGGGTYGLQTLGFTVFAEVTSGSNYFPETAFTYSAGTYTSTTKYYWPSSGTLDFFAYQYSQSAKNTVTHTALTKAFAVTPSSTAANQTDLVIACTTGKDKATYGTSGVTLNFRHAESKVTIKLKNSSTTTTITAGDVVLGNVYTTGTYTFTGSTDNAAGSPSSVANTDGNNNSTYLKYGDWSGQGTSGSYTQAAATTSYTSATAATALTNSMILIPQTLTNANAYASSASGAAFNGADITVALKIQHTTHSAYIVGGAGASVTAMWPLPATKWLPGHHYTYTVDLAGGGYFPTNQADTDDKLDPILAGSEIKFVTVTVDSWADGGDIPVPPAS